MTYVSKIEILAQFQGNRVDVDTSYLQRPFNDGLQDNRLILDERYFNGISNPALTIAVSISGFPYEFSINVRDLDKQAESLSVDIPHNGFKLSLADIPEAHRHQYYACIENVKKAVADKTKGIDWVIEKAGARTLVHLELADVILQIFKRNGISAEDDSKARAALRPLVTFLLQQDPLKKTYPNVY